jgi:hypothetical protein
MQTQEALMAHFNVVELQLVGPAGQLEVRGDDEVTRKLLMLIEGECDGLGPIEAAKKFGYSKQRYFQLRATYRQQGAAGLQSHKRGPKHNYRRTPELVRQVIRHRFLDPEASLEVIAQKLVQSGWTISVRSVDRVIAEYGLQKKTAQVPPPTRRRAGRGARQPQGGPPRRRRSGKHRTRGSATLGR